MYSIHLGNSHSIGFSVIKFSKLLSGDSAVKPEQTNTVNPINKCNI